MAECVNCGDKQFLLLPDKNSTSTSLIHNSGPRNSNKSTLDLCYIDTATLLY